MFFITIIAVVISGIALLFTGLAARATTQQAKAAVAQTDIQRAQVDLAREQVNLQRDLAREALQPYVWADIQPDMQQGTILEVVVGNAGPTLAQDVRVTFEPQLPTSSSQADTVERVQRQLARGLHSLAPHRILHWPLGPGFELLSPEGPRAVTICVDAIGPYGNLPRLKFEVDMSEWREARDAPDGSLHHVRTAIDGLTKAVKDRGR